MTSRQKKINIITALVLFVVLLVVIILYYLKLQNKSAENFQVIRDKDGKIVISATSFPVYDFAKEVGGDKVSVSLLLPPGIEAHTFKPTNKELSEIASSSVVFYTSSLLETWVDDLKETLNKKTRLVDSTAGLVEGGDPHIWLDPTKASLMVDNIKKAYQLLDPVNYNYYELQANNYKNKLQTLDQLYFSSLKNCKYKDLVQGGHQAFAYLARRYDLNYLPAQGVVPISDVDMDKTLAQIERLKASGQGYIYYEELIMPSLAEVIRQQTGAKMIMLNAAHNVARFDLENGLNFIKIMENNLNALKLGLSCQ
jgi:zinc transport system substrate-binding protein